MRIDTELKGGKNRMENEIKEQKNSKKKFIIPALVFGVLLLGVFVTATIAYFYTVQVDLNVGEGRSSADIPVTLSFLSGESSITEKTIHNSANVPLCAVLDWNEVENIDGVTYTTNLPQTITLSPLSDTTVSVSFMAGEVTNSGRVVGNITYSKVPCS